MTDNNNILIKATRHEIWGWPAAANFILGGTACGFFLFSLIHTEFFTEAKTIVPWFDYNIISPFLVALGFLTVGIEAGSPLRGIFLLHHLKSSWMSREVLMGILFIFFALLEAAHSHAAFKIIAAISAAGLMLCQGFMVYRAKAVTVWVSFIILYYFITSGLMLGFGFMLFWAAAVAQEAISSPVLLLGLFGLFANLAVWYLIVKPKSIALEDRAVIHLRDPFSMTMTFGFGHVVPVLLVSAILIFAAAGSTNPVALTLSMITGICILAGGIVQKIALILQTNTLCPIRSGNPKFQIPNCPGS